MKEKVEINYIDEKVKNSPIIISEGEDHFIILASKEKEQIKKSVMGILECTNLNEELDKNNDRIFILNEKVTKHIFGAISKDTPYNEKKEIIKEIIKDNLKNKNQFVLLIRDDKIYIITNGKNLKDNPNKISGRFDGYTEESLNFLIKENLGNNFNGKEILTEILNEIDLSKKNIKEILEFIESKYKQELLHLYANKLHTEYNIDKEIIIALAGKLLRENFNFAKEYITKLFFDEVLKKHLNEDKIKEINQSINTIIENKYLDLSKSNFDLKYIKYITTIYFNELKAILKKQIENIFSRKLKIDKEQYDIITKKYITSIQKLNNEKIIDKYLAILIENIYENISSGELHIKENINNIFKEILKHNPDIKVKHSEINYDFIKFTDEVKKSLSRYKSLKDKISILEKELKNYNKDHIKTEIKNENTQKDKNNNEIKQYLKKINFEHLDGGNLNIKYIREEIAKLRVKEREENKILKKLKNSIVKNLNKNKINSLENNIKRIKEKITYLHKIIKKYDENYLISNKLEKLQEELTKINKKEEELEKYKNELKEVEKKITNTKEAFKNLIKKYILELN